MQDVIEDLGRVPRQRTTLYDLAPDDRHVAALAAAPLADLPPTTAGVPRHAIVA